MANFAFKPWNIDVHCIYKALCVQSAESTLSHKMFKLYNLYFPVQFKAQLQRIEAFGKVWIEQKNSKAAQIITKFSNGSLTRALINILQSFQSNLNSI